VGFYYIAPERRYREIMLNQMILRELTPPLLSSIPPLQNPDLIFFKIQ